MTDPHFIALLAASTNILGAFKDPRVIKRLKAMVTQAYKCGIITASELTEIIEYIVISQANR